MSGLVSSRMSRSMPRFRTVAARPAASVRSGPVIALARQVADGAHVTGEPLVVVGQARAPLDHPSDRAAIEAYLPVPDGPRAKRL